MSVRDRGGRVRLGLIGFGGGLPFELVSATEALGLEPTASEGQALTLVDAREELADELLAGLKGRSGVTVAYGDAPENDPVFDGAFDDAIASGSGEGIIRRRLTIAMRLAETLRAREPDEDGKAEALRMANSSLEFALRRFEALFQGLPAACFTMDLEGTIHEWNREATAVLGLQAYEAVYRTAEEAFGVEWGAELLASRLEEGESAFDWSFRRPDGRLIHLDGRLLAIHAEGGERTAIVAANLDVTARVRAVRQADLATRREERARRKLQAANAALEAIALTDPLTGLGNRRRFEEILLAARERERRSGTPFALLLLDIDRFKLINDAHGHGVGDEVLRELGSLLRTTARKMETPARLGGEEFALVLEGCDEGRAMLVAERLRVAMAGHEWPVPSVTASFGVASFRAGESDERLYERADSALYAAKRGGRDQARLAA